MHCHQHSSWRLTHLLDNIGRELLNRQRADVSNELADDGLTEAVVVEVQDILDNVVAKGVLNKVESIEGDLSHELDALG